MTATSKSAKATKGSKSAKAAKAPKAAKVRTFPNPGYGFTKKAWGKLGAEAAKENWSLGMIIQHMAKKVYGIDAKAE